jgi:acetyltransferase-like isoleucine patch superfamily enzyme
MNLFALLPRITYRLRGACYRAAIVASGGQCGGGLRVEPGLRFRHGPHRGITIGRDVYIGVGTIVDCPPGGVVAIGDNVTLTHGTFISAAKSVTIGDDTLIGEYVSIRDANHQMDISPVPIRNQPMIAEGCEIGSDVWIGRGCAVLAGATLRDGCVIGANAVVMGEIPRHAIAVGAPAHVVGQRPAGAAADAGRAG